MILTRKIALGLVKKGVAEFGGVSYDSFTNKSHVSITRFDNQTTSACVIGWGDLRGSDETPEELVKDSLKRPTTYGFLTNQTGENHED